LATTEAALSRILSGYLDGDGQVFDNCVVATVAGRGWDLTRADGPAVMWAASLLFLSSFAASHYFPRFGGPYTNSTVFQVTGQGFRGDTPVWITVVARRRDGSSMNGGYRHGEFKVNVPVQVSLRDFAEIDEDFLAALDRADAAGSETMKRLRTAMPFVRLANTDDDVMTEHAEAVLMGAAFEQLFGGFGKYQTGKAFAALLAPFGKQTVADALKVRPHIRIDADPARAAAQPDWFVHQKWLEELYELRNDVIHDGTDQGRNWGWQLHEHLVMAAFVFPLAVKLLLQQEGHYRLSSADEAQCKAVDQLLAVVDCDSEDEEEADGRAWHKIVTDTKWDHDTERRLAEFLKKNPDHFKQQADPESGELT
jgi:hypothetical protein